MIVACVLRGDWPDGSRYVANLRSGFQRYLRAPHRFTVLTDHDWFPEGAPPEVPADVEWVVPLKHAWPRWWPKILALDPSLFPAGELVLLVDLDTVLVGEVTPVADYPGEFAVLNDVFQGSRMIGSGLLLFRPGGGTSRTIWEDFTRDPQGVMSRNRIRMDHYLHGFLKEADRVQDFWPGMVVSYKGDCLDRRHRNAPARIPEGASVVCFHGRPRPHEVPEGDPVLREWER